jgi:hypothetical protein
MLFAVFTKSCCHPHWPTFRAVLITGLRNLILEPLANETEMFDEWGRRPDFLFPEKSPNLPRHISQEIFLKAVFRVSGKELICPEWLSAWMPDDCPEFHL